MLTLLTYPGSANTFSFSPYCVKAALLLCFADVTWRRKDKTDPRSMPHQKLPVLKTEQKLVPDSDGIRTWLEQKGTDFDPGLTASERAQSRALIRMAEEHLYFHVVQDRWADDRVWPILRSRFFVSVPALIRRPVAHKILKSVLNGLSFQGVSRFSNIERRDQFEIDLKALSDLIFDRGFIAGPAISSTDLSIGPMLQAMCDTPVETELQQRVSGDPVFTNYLNQPKARFPIMSESHP